MIKKLKIKANMLIKNKNMCLRRKDESKKDLSKIKQEIIEKENMDNINNNFSDMSVSSLGEKDDSKNNKKNEENKIIPSNKNDNDNVSISSVDKKDNNDNFSNLEDNIVIKT